MDGWMGIDKVKVVFFPFISPKAITLLSVAGVRRFTAGREGRRGGDPESEHLCELAGSASHSDSQLADVASLC